MAFQANFAAAGQRLLPLLGIVAGVFTVRVLLLGGFLVVCLFGVIWWPAWWLALNDRFAPRYDGQIIVNSPAVYTRQRLVNDRLAQSSWLRDELRFTTREFEADFRSIDEVRTVRNSSGLSAQFGVGKPGGDGGITRSSTLLEDSKTDAAQAAAVPTIRPTSADLFRAKNSYREEVRAEIMETQLDDRHDIQGNTIYRLSFDATVLPGTRSDALAVIKVKLLHDHSQIEKQPEAKRALDQEYFQLYEDWLRYMQKLVHRSVGNIAKTLYERKPEERVAYSLPHFVLKRICEMMHGLKGAPECDPATMPGSAQLNAASKTVSDFTAAYLGARTAKFQDQLRLNIITQVRLENGRASEKTEIPKKEEVQKGSDGKEGDPAKRELKQEKSFVYALEESYHDCEQSLAPDFNKPSLETGEPITVRCPSVNPPTEGLIGASILYEALAKAVAITADEAARISATLLDDMKKRCAGEQVRTCNLPDTTKEALRCLAADYMWSQLNLHDRGPGSRSPGISLDDRLDNPSSSGYRLDRYIQVQITGRETGLCNIVFLSGMRNKGTGDDPVTRMRLDLNRGVEVYAYSITPKNLAQRLSTASDTRDSVQALLNTNFSAGSRDISSLIENLQKKSMQSQAVQSLPVVVGYGLAPSAASTENPDFAPHTEFGWVIAPQIKIGKQDERAHSDRQYALGSVISVPSWWRSMNLSIETCWVERGDLHKQREFKQCVDKDTGESMTVHTVRLPGAISELSRKLGYEVAQEPRLDFQYPKELPLVLEIGRPAQVLLKGGRVWRSTEVTLGAQRADEIAVLPNMEGILAKFRCVRRQYPSDIKDPAFPIRVWTSEGVTEESEYAKLIEPPADDGSKGKRAETCPDERQEMQATAPVKEPVKEPIKERPPVAGQPGGETR